MFQLFEDVRCIKKLLSTRHSNISRCKQWILSMESRKQSHKEWRKSARKLQRKRRRRLVAQKRDEELKKEQESPTHEARLAKDRASELIELETIKLQNEIENEKWIDSELEIEMRWRQHMRKIEEQKRIEETERQRKHTELEGQEKRKLRIEQEKKRRADEDRQFQYELKRKIDDFLKSDGPVPIELITNAETNPARPVCQFFEKTAACRFGNKCIRNHIRPRLSTILLISRFFTNFSLEQSKATEYGSDLTLEYNERDLYDDFKDFFDDVIPELQRFGRILHFVVCHNYVPHLRGHVYAEYDCERSALRAQQALNGRYYACRMLNVEFCRIIWKNAVCGLSLRKQCPKGRDCSFLHIFKNPFGQYSVNETLWLSRGNRRNTGVNETKNPDSWNDEPEKSQRNWRWSVSPDRESIGRSLEQLVPLVQTSENIKMDDSSTCKSSSRKRKQSSQRSSQKKSHSRIRSQSKRKKKKRSRSRSGSRKKSKKSSNQTPERRRK